MSSEAVKQLSKIDYQTLALAGIFEAAIQVEKLATQGMKDKQCFQVLLNSLFIQNPKSPEDVYSESLQSGFEGLIQFLEQGKRKGSHTDRYVHGLLYLQKKLVSTPNMLNTIGQRLELARTQKDHFGVDHENLVSNLASLYTDTLSTFNFRIQVMGEMTYLQQPRIANQIRALLLAGIRSATLWRQMGGNRWQFLLSRRKLLASAEAQLYEIRKNPSKSD
ncbi:high frequency lysogenization protein HflD [Simiduia curdlanivorans]|uniref:High frequency lysogenization protein HflD homolog n=1 Tax=Simiduia curdlanivorans TaxID=1492769 RepID=A0ABV8V8L1_9GAMM|nr:high frequency lysogenization protein HflD [Simiduia curdlanivorans]MDN3639833.1 high frequency lysogenization protein HflD [Simiduia curdlanivorans]